MQRILKICQQSSSGSDLLEELVNSGAPEIAIYLRMYLHASSFSAAAKTVYARSALISMSKYVAATTFVWTMVILSSIEASQDHC